MSGALRNFFRRLQSREYLPMTMDKGAAGLKCVAFSAIGERLKVL